VRGRVLGFGKLGDSVGWRKAEQGKAPGFETIGSGMMKKEVPSRVLGKRMFEKRKMDRLARRERIVEKPFGDCCRYIKGFQLSTEDRHTAANKERTGSTYKSAILSASSSSSAPTSSSSPVSLSTSFLPLVTLAATLPPLILLLL
jgi:hypothetical protein